MPQNVYDNPEFFARYSQFRRSVEGLAGAAEWPVLRGMLPPLDGARVLDLGCGFGWFCRWAREYGAASVVGIDLSEKMLERARQDTDDPGITYLLGSIEAFDFPLASFDLVFSSLAFHYVERFDAVCERIARVLTPGGGLVFSVEHPIYTAPSHPGWVDDGGGDRAWPLNSYQDQGLRRTDWLVEDVLKYHRTVATYINTLIRAGFRLLRLEEWGPTTDELAAQPAFDDERQRPTFMLVAAVKES
ncbi:MAG: class I SAM-dependent methyltransferase [Tepidiformaceae bacterium]